MKKMNKIFLADLGLLFVAASWGFNFIVMKVALFDITPLLYLGVRFILATLLLVAIFYKRLKETTRRDLRAGLIIGVFLFGAFATQIIALQYVDPGKSGFIAGTTVVLVPFMYFVVTKKKPDIYSLVGAVAALVGFGFLSLTSSFTIEWGDALMFISSILFAAHVVSVGIFAPQGDPLVLSTIQIGVTGVASMISAVIFEPMTAAGLTPNVWWAIFFGIVFCTIGAFVIQNVAQQVTPPTHAALILAMESVFAMLFSILWGFETLTLRSGIGGALILSGVILSETKLGKLEETEKPEQQTI